MKTFLAVLLFLSVIGGNLQRASRINQAVQQAEVLYKQHQYHQAYAVYQYLTDSLRVPDNELKLNLAHAAFMAGDLTYAQKVYTSLTKNNYPVMQSVALTQLGLIYYKKDNPEKALYYFKKALIRNSLNEVARYNYELVKKYLADHPAPLFSGKNKKKPLQKHNNAAENSQPAKPTETGTAGTTNDNNTPGNNPPANKAQNNSTGNQDQAGTGPGQNSLPNSGAEDLINQGEKGNATRGLANETGNNSLNQGKAGTEASRRQDKEMQTLRARLQHSDLSPEKARMLLEAIRVAEWQYLQQVPRKPAPPRKQHGPDW